MRKVILNVPEDLHAALQQRKAETGTPTSVFIRRTLQQALAVTQPKVETR